MRRRAAREEDDVPKPPADAAARAVALLASVVCACGPLAGCSSAGVTGEPEEIETLVEVVPGGSRCVHDSEGDSARFEVRLRNTGEEERTVTVTPVRRFADGDDVGSSLDGFRVTVPGEARARATSRSTSPTLSRPVSCASTAARRPRWTCSGTAPERRPGVLTRPVRDMADRRVRKSTVPYARTPAGHLPDTPAVSRGSQFALNNKEPGGLPEASSRPPWRGRGHRGPSRSQ